MMPTTAPPKGLRTQSDKLPLPHAQGVREAESPSPPCEPPEVAPLSARPLSRPHSTTKGTQGGETLIVHEPREVSAETAWKELTDERWCGKGCLVGWAPNGEKAKLVPLTCDRWDCPRCGPRKAKRWLAKLLSARPTRHIVVTCRPGAAPDPDTAATLLKRTWSRFVDNWRRKGRTCEYAWVLQWQKNGWPHLHILQRGSYIPQVLISSYFLLRSEVRLPHSLHQTHQEQTQRHPGRHPLHSRPPRTRRVRPAQGQSNPHQPRLSPGQRPGTRRDRHGRLGVDVSA